MNFNHMVVGDQQAATTHEGTGVAGWKGWCQACGVVGCRWKVEGLGLRSYDVRM